MHSFEMHIQIAIPHSEIVDINCPNEYQLEQILLFVL